MSVFNSWEGMRKVVFYLRKIEAPRNQVVFVTPEEEVSILQFWHDSMKGVPIYGMNESGMGITYEGFTFRFININDI